MLNSTSSTSCASGKIFFFKKRNLITAYHLTSHVPGKDTRGGWKSGHINLQDCEEGATPSRLITTLANYTYD